MLQEPVHAIIVMPVELPGEHHADAVLGELTALDQNMDGPVIERLRRMVGDLAVIGIRAAIEQQLGQFRMMSDACRAVERALPFGPGLVLLVEETGIWVGACIEQKFGVATGNTSTLRIRYYNIQPDRFSWTADRSTDAGKTWSKEDQKIEAHRIGPARSLGELAPAR